MPRSTAARIGASASTAASATRASPFATGVTGCGRRSRIACRGRLACATRGRRNRRIARRCDSRWRRGARPGLFIPGTDFSLVRGNRGSRGIRIHEAVLARIVSDGRILVEGDDTRPGITFGHGSRNAGRRRSGNEAAAQSIARRGLQRLPFLSVLRGHDRFANTSRSGGRENSVLQIQRSLTLLIKGMHGHDAKFAVLANEDCRCSPIEERMRRMNDGREAPSRTSPRSVNHWRCIKPAAAAGVEEPATVMVRSPAPRLGTHPRPAERRVPNPLPGREG
jgi:hypothetical protein